MPKTDEPVRDSTESFGTGLAMRLQPEEIRVLRILADAKAMPFLELRARSDVEENTLHKILESLQNTGIVRITNAGDVFEEIVTVRDRGLQLAYST